MSYIGATQGTSSPVLLDSITVVNNQAAYTMQKDGVNYTPASTLVMQVSLNGIIQQPGGGSYTINGSTITFDSALVTGDVIDYILVREPTTGTIAPIDGSITTSKLANGAVTDAKITSMASSKLTGALPALDGSALTGVSAGKVLNVVQTVETSVSSYSCARGAFVDLGISASITPSSASNKILVMVSASVSTSVTDQACVITLYQGGSPSAFIGDTAGNRQRNTATAAASYDRHFGTCAFSYLASVSDTNPVTFELYGSHTASVTRTLYVNQANSDSDLDYYHRGASSIILMEIEN